MKHPLTLKLNRLASDKGRILLIDHVEDLLYLSSLLDKPIEIYLVMKQGTCAVETVIKDPESVALMLLLHLDIPDAAKGVMQEALKLRDPGTLQYPFKSIVIGLMELTANVE